MKLKLTVILTAGVVALGLLLSASTAHAAPEVIFEGNNATGIQDLEVDGILYNVEFLFDSAENIYGNSPIFDFQNGIKAEAASSAVRAALNSEPAVTTVGPEEANVYIIGFSENGPFVEVTQDYYDQVSGGPWTLGQQSLRFPSNLDTYADFTQVSLPPVDTVVVPIPRTGQTQIYDRGDDGDLQKGVPWPVPRFTDNGDGTVTDNLTGLIWMQFAFCLQGTWTWVLDAINNLSDGACGNSDGSQPGDWRLPNRRELESLIDIGQRNPAMPAGHPFEQVPDRAYWTSSSAAPVQWGELAAWSVDITSGEATIQGKERLLNGWPVRGGN